MRIVIGADDVHPTVEAVVAWAELHGHEINLLPTALWPDVGRAVGESVAKGAADLGVVACWTGTGVSIAANKVPGIRAALCADAQTAAGARTWNDANVLAFSIRSTSVPIVQEMLDAFIHTATDDAERATIALVD